MYCLRTFYNQPNCCKGLKVCMNGRIFYCRCRGNEQCENSCAKVGGGDQSIGEPRGPKSGEARAHRPNRSLRLCTSILQRRRVAYLITASTIACDDDDVSIGRRRQRLDAARSRM